jgi:hypothetical protein
LPGPVPLPCEPDFVPLPFKRLPIAAFPRPSPVAFSFLISPFALVFPVVFLVELATAGVLALSLAFLVATGGFLVLVGMGTVFSGISFSTFSLAAFATSVTISFSCFFLRLEPDFLLPLLVLQVLFRFCCRHN